VVDDALLLGSVEAHPVPPNPVPPRCGNLDRTHHRLVVPVLAGAHDQARTECPARDDERIVPDRWHRRRRHDPPPTKWTISNTSPGSTGVSARRARSRISRLCSTTTRPGCRPSSASKPATVNPAGTRRGSPFNVISI